MRAPGRARSRKLGPLLVGRTAAAAPIDCETLGPVTPAEPLQRERALGPENLERKEVLPLGPARVEARHLPAPRPEEGEDVVLDRRGPDPCRRQPGHDA